MIIGGLAEGSKQGKGFESKERGKGVGVKMERGGRGGRELT